MRLTDFKVLTFDCYGTLIDWETGILNALRPLLRRDPVERSRDEVLASFARHETAQEKETPGMIYSELLTQTHRRIAAEFGIAASAADYRAFGGSVGDWPAFSPIRPRRSPILSSFISS
jgi:FMN phosphatase YigB (HAD superfamily)